LVAFATRNALHAVYSDTNFLARIDFRH